MAKSDKLYSKSPRLERDENGDMGVTQPTDADSEDMGLSGNPVEGTPGEMPIETHNAGERREMHHRHVHEKLAMHHRHEQEHASNSGEKKPLHKKHEMELKDLHDKHHGELVAMHKRHEKTKG